VEGDEVKNQYAKSHAKKRVNKMYISAEPTGVVIRQKCSNRVKAFFGYMPDDAPDGLHPDTRVWSRKGLFYVQE
jgi:hypothetical protein